MNSRLLVVLITTTILVVISKGGLSSNFDYHERGPDKWPSLYPIECSGHRQSPINIEDKDTIYDQLLTAPIRFDIIKNVSDFIITNDGHKVNIQIPDNTFAINFGYGKNFIATAMHWHWGKSNNIGSEHTINGHAAPIELHIVTWNNLYDSFPEAASARDGLAVVGVLYQLNDGNQGSILDNVIQSFHNVKQCQECKKAGDPQPTDKIPGFDLNKLLPDKTTQYYRYDGSLTTPVCTENVMWTVMHQKFPITQHQMDAFRSLLQPNGEYMVNNFRPVQPLNPPGQSERSVFRSFH